MATTKEIEEFYDAYKAWNAATGEYMSAIGQTLVNNPVPDSVMKEIVDRMARLHREWMEKSKPLIFSGP